MKNQKGVISKSDIILVDTDVYSYLGKPGSRNASLYTAHTEGKRIALSFITIGELYFGARKSNWSEDRIGDLADRLRSVAIVPYDIEVCKVYGEIKAKLVLAGKRIEDNDLWIAACAIRHSIPLVSNNRKHFERVPGLILVSEAKAMAEMTSQMTIKEVTTAPISPEGPSSQ